MTGATMIRRIELGFSLTLLALSTPIYAENAKTSSPEPGNSASASQSDELAKGVTLLQSGQPAEAVSIFSGIISAYEQRYGAKTVFRCTSGKPGGQALATAFGEALTSDKRDVVLGNEDWCTALWGKGFALIDLNRSAEAGPYLARAVELDPDNAHFINEYAEWFKPQREFKQSFDLFSTAWKTVDHDKQGPHRRVAARSLRGIAFNLIELGDLDGAEQKYRQSLEYEPEAAGKVQGELDYIVQQRAARKKTS